MSNRSLLELNHDYAPPRDDDALLEWARKMRDYLGCADPELLPPGVTRKAYRHHSELCPVIAGEAAQKALKDIASRAAAHVAHIIQ